jgi:DNA-3-methyladenine glycosylase I
MKKTNINKIRCAWVSHDPIDIHYHDDEWGVPIYDDRLLFEFLVLEGMQAGLSWRTILKKRDNYRAVFDNFNAEKIIQYNDNKIAELLNYDGIIRNKLKINAVIVNAAAYLRVKKEFGSFADYIWRFVDGKPIKNHWENVKCVPTTSIISDHLAQDLKKRGFKFVGSTICYAFIQAVGMVNDHTQNCFRYNEIV